jgi:hypothetical protein
MEPLCSRSLDHGEAEEAVHGRVQAGRGADDAQPRFSNGRGDRGRPGRGPNVLHRWAAKLDKSAVAKRNVEGETLDQEVRRLRKEVEQLRVDKAILKKQRPSCVTSAPGDGPGANCIRDEGGPLGAGHQGRAPNHLKLRRSSRRGER